MSMGTKHIKSWIAVLSVFLLVVALWAGWRRFTLPSVEPPTAQLLADPEPAVARARRSVVSLWAIEKSARDRQIRLVGCGLIVDSRGYVLTSAALPPDIESLRVIGEEEQAYEAKVITTDETAPLTLIKVDRGGSAGAEGFEAAALADSEQVAEGDDVIAVGGRRTPSSWELTTRTGRITKQRQSLVVEEVRYRRLIQTDVSLSSDNAGGPLVNVKGEVIGFSLPFVYPPNSPSSFSYAVPINQGKEFLARLPLPQWTDAPAGQVCSWLGAELLPLNPVMAAQLSVPERRGEVVNYIQARSPAAAAGLRRGDVITAINGKRIGDRAAFDEMAPTLCQKDSIRLRILREGQEKQLTLDWNEPTYALPRTGSLAEVVLVVLIFSLMYYLVYRNVLDRVVLFVLSAIVIAIAGHYLGFYEQDRMASALLSKIDVLCFIVGMQLTTAVLEQAGAVEYLAKKITLVTRGDTWRIMSLFCLITYALSLVVNNLTTIMLMAPMLLRLSKYLGCDPKPFLVSIIIASNLGGASTMVGDFPNMLIGAEVGLPFYQFAYHMLPICLLELFVLLLYLRIARRSLFKSQANSKNAPGTGAPLLFSKPEEFPDYEPWDRDFPELAGHANASTSDGSFFRTIRDSLPKAIKSQAALKRGMVILVGVIGGFLAADSLNCSPAIIALAGGIIALAFGACEPLSLLRKVSIRDILFFSGLFVLVGAAEASGGLDYISQVIVRLSFGNPLVLCLLLMWAAALVTCFLNAGPATALFLPVVLSFRSAAPDNLYWWSLSLGVCAGSSGTLVGATAGSVAATMIDKFRKREEARSPVSPTSANGDTGRYTKLTFREYSALGLPMMFIFLLISSVYIAVIYRW